ncbi:MAG TPA: hypothetical protein DET40_11795 [Lentisphaeria bacterium]|nr:hypothetical protein [Lentisphaeria bacterium]
MNYPDASIEVSKIKSESKKRRCDFKNMDAALAEQSDACQRQNRVPPFIIPRRFALGMEGHACHDQFLSFEIPSRKLKPTQGSGN